MLILETFARVPHIRGPPASGARSWAHIVHPPRLHRRRCIHPCRRERPWLRTEQRTSLTRSNANQAATIALQWRIGTPLPSTPSSSSSQWSPHAPSRPLKSP